MKILLTGATGFIGVALVPELLGAGHQVIAAVRNHSEQLPERVEQRVVGEMGSKTQWDSVLEGIEGVIHLAGLAHVTRGRASREDAAFNEINVGGTRALALDSAKRGIKRFVFMSSLHAVASHSDQPITENTVPFPDSAYARSKLEAEAALKETLGPTNTSWTILRPPLVYGKGQKANMQKLFHAVQSGWPLPFGAVKNQRSLIGLNNLCHLVSTCLIDDRANNQTFLCSDGPAVSTRDLIEKIGVACGQKARLVPVLEFFLRGVGGIPGMGAVTKLIDSLYVDDSYVRTVLGWRPPFTLEEGLRKIVKLEKWECGKNLKG